MPSTSAPSEPWVPVWHYDGATAHRRSAALVLRGEGFVVDEEGREDGPHAFRALIAQRPHEGQPRFGLRKRPGWSVTLREEPPQEIAARLPRAKRYGGVIDRIGLVPAMIAFAVVSALVVLGVATAPSYLARMIPRSAEERLGNLIVGDFGGRTCETPQGRAALDALAARLGAEDARKIRVVNLPLINAAALPGGTVVIFEGLLRTSASADEVAGVLAHELGHVANRDVMEQLVRQLGLSVVLGGLDGNVGGYTNAILSATYSRSAETRADLHAIAALGRANVSTRGLADFFGRMAGAEGRPGRASAVLGYLSSHPLSSERQARFAEGARAGGGPALSPGQWRALRTICVGGGARPADDFRF